MKWAGELLKKKQLTVYVHPRVKQGMKLVAVMEGTDLSDLVERLLVEYLQTKEGIGDLIEKKRP